MGKHGESKEGDIRARLSMHWLTYPGSQRSSFCLVLGWLQGPTCWKSILVRSGTCASAWRSPFVSMTGCGSSCSTGSAPRPGKAVGEAQPLSRRRRQSLGRAPQLSKPSNALSFIRLSQYCRMCLSSETDFLWLLVLNLYVPGWFSVSL